MENKVGIVILNFNGSEFLHLTIDALKRAKCEARFQVGVIDNGSKKEDAKIAQRIAEESFANGMEGFFIASAENLGFSGGNNVVIKRFMEDESITHICLLNSDVIVTDHWLDRLLASDMDCVGPVTNAAGNDQTVMIDYEIQPDFEAYAHVNAYATKRYEVYSQYHTQADILYFFTTLLKRSVIDKIGLLDEQFYPGSFEDNDYCLRIAQAGFTQHINRGVFVHHFGSGSFSKLNMPKRIDITNENRMRFEKKWNTKWHDVYWKLIESARLDMMFFEGKEVEPWALSLISSAFIAAEGMIEKWTEAIAFYQSEQYKESLCSLNEVPWKTIRNQIVLRIKKRIMRIVKNGSRSE